ncbi:hypothetical protein [Clostridium saccharobutylicum]|uniref:Uncharacterized protein n=1 Tax=Clostridium saccharobutylicum DSM 13864 TaxID=1345695 RepID=U5MUA5_CLOSA|nr:hypothetical protein [Clostridium saccharobutylicum]AGX44108.1 hypothetical protein CLSA_c31420 [Clostridium saccharobutylicum DSM 13864]AQR91398.1 hypothetical protein CLOSC_31230 [Clostridium saccharobutylicum]AQS01302.1 hypothetical protein CSACC_31300 [Clostridium saccharobutylicum]AQS10912.1 hypothetical protein CLOBY_30610 [Clostridium saccharobutylicum]AQS15285.1 hypothetical protein CLOSACC_31300 [Clostridium saccharobutylicum]
MKNNNNNSSHETPNSDPSSQNYSKKMKNKANEKSPFGSDEPSTKTTFK